MRLEAFTGVWEIDRQIEDTHAGQVGRFTGRAVFTPDGDGLKYREEGRFRLGDGPEMTASRDYLWRDAGGGTIEVRFGDGRYFHRFLAEEAKPGDIHECNPDTYRVAYDFSAWPRWVAEWRVIGPRKDYGMVSRFRRP